MNYAQWAAENPVSISLPQLKADFLLDGGGWSAFSVPAAHDPPDLDDVSREVAILSMSFATASLLTREWFDGLNSLPYASPPLLILEGDKVNGSEIPYIHLTLSETADSYEPQALAGADRPVDVPGLCSTYARLHNYHQQERDGVSILWSRRVLDRAIKDFTTLYPSLIPNQRAMFLTALARNFAACASAYYDFSKIGSIQTVDSRVSISNELILLTLSALTEHSERSHTTDQRFVSDLFGIAALGGGEYDLICACGILLWSTAY